MCKKRVQTSLDEKNLTYLKSLVESGEAASLSHAIRKIVGQRMREEKGEG